MIPIYGNSINIKISSKIIKCTFSTVPGEYSLHHKC